MNQPEYHDSKVEESKASQVRKSKTAEKVKLEMCRVKVRALFTARGQTMNRAHGWVILGEI